MELTPALLAMAAVLPFASGVLLELILRRMLSGRAKGVLAVLCCLPALAGVVAAIPQVQRGAALDVSLLRWDGPLVLAVHIDALSVLFAFMGTAIGGIVLLYSIGYMAKDRGATRFYCLMLTFIGGLAGLVYSANLFLLYLCWELVGLCSFGLVGFWYTDAEAVRGARKVLLMTHLAGYGLLAAILTIYSRTGSSLWTDPAVARAFSGGIFFLMLIALLAKSVQFPLHTWIPDAMAAPTPVSALLHAACYVKAGVYLAARMHSFGPWHPQWSASMIWIGTTTMLIGVMYAMVQSDLKRMLAFHTVSQIGYMILGIGIGTPLAITAGLLHCLAHGFFKGGLFLAAGSVQHAAGTRDMNELGGLAQRMPWTSAVWLISAGCIMGFPLMSGFTGKWMLYTAAIQAGLALPALAAWLASVGTVFSFAKATSVVFLGPATSRTENVHEAPLSMQWGLGLIAAGSLVLSVAPQLVISYLLNPIVQAFGMMPAMEVSWFGLTGSMGSWWITGGIVMALVSLAAGALVYAMARPASVWATGGPGLAVAGGGIFTGGEPLTGEGRLPASDFSAIFKAQWAPFYHGSDVDQLFVRAWNGLQRLSAALARPVAAVERHAAIWTLCFAGVLFCWLEWFAAPSAGGEVMTLPSLPPVFAASCVAACAALCAAALAIRSGRALAPLMLLSGGSACAGLLVPQPAARLALLEISGLLALLLVWRFTASQRVRWTYLTVLAASALTLIPGELLLEQGSPQLVRALLTTGLLLKLAAVPFLVWLLVMAEAVPALVLGLIVAVVDIALFGELYTVASAAPWILQPQALWFGVAIASALGGALLMLSQKNLKRLLILSTVEDVGFLLLGMASATAFGIRAALLGASVHAVAKSLLFTSLSAAESDNQPAAEGGLAAAYPISATGFLFGMLAMLGVPPTIGYAARWRLYTTAGEASTAILAVFLVSSALALIAYVLALTRVWWGPRQEAGAASEPVALRFAIIGLILLLLATGLWPEAITGALS